MDNDHITRLETALAHQDQQIQELSEIVNKQWKDIEALNRRLDKALAQIADAIASGGEGKEQSATEFAAANKPPHY